ncbi:DUF86 domain-containing protein [Agromyces aurantiacus]|uniref:DUF86 domain-containing protein n=1 Tax=Agromyces aurantiacus TaxID=165814 RepID=A0ABV9R2C0_9MICO|nr:hypothetical protein [Agromyces aurantiacus]MBM7505917.1 uncharacterized protein with HEPN domain [Agromyces aurantiacus]
MSRSSRARLGDILAACAAIEDYAARSDDDPIVFDAIRIRLVEIGEAVKDLDPSVTSAEPDIPGSRSSECGTNSRTVTSTPRTRSS